MVYVKLLVYLLLFSGPIIGYRIAARGLKPRRWKLMVYAAAGGAVAALLLIAALWSTELSSDTSAVTMLRNLVLSYALFGFVLGCAGLFLRTARRFRLIVAGVAVLGLMGASRMAITAATHQPPETGAAGLVIGPTNVPAVGAPVFVDRGSGAIERLTTDTAGVFRVPRRVFAHERPVLMICVPGAVPFLARVDEDFTAPEPYPVMALPPNANVEPGIRSGGWTRAIPRECLSGSVKS